MAWLAVAVECCPNLKPTLGVSADTPTDRLWREITYYGRGPDPPGCTMWVSENKTVFLLRLRLFPLSADWHALRFHSGSEAESFWLPRVTPLKFALQYPQPTLLGVF